MENMITECKQKIEDTKLHLNQLNEELVKNEEIEKKVRVGALTCASIGFLIYFIGSLAMNSIVALIGLFIHLGIAPFGFYLFHVEDLVEKGKKEIEETNDKIKEYEDDLVKLYSKKEVYDLIKAQNKAAKLNQPLPMTINSINNKDNNKTR